MHFLFQQLHILYYYTHLNLGASQYKHWLNAMQLYCKNVVFSGGGKSENH